MDGHCGVYNTDDWLSLDRLCARSECKIECNFFSSNVQVMALSTCLVCSKKSISKISTSRDHESIVSVVLEER